MIKVSAREKRNYLYHLLLAELTYYFDKHIIQYSREEKMEYNGII